MFVKRLIHKAVHDLPIPSGNLKESQLRPQLAVHHGIPHSGIILAYEPVQRLLAVSSSDGRTKILGAVGVEGLLQSATQFPCKFLEFLNNRGYLVHINTQNDIEVWDVEMRELIYFQKWETDVTSFSVLQGSPFMFLGDQTGSVFVLEFVDDDHQLNIMPYVMPAYVTLGGLIRMGSSDAPSVISVLPQPEFFFTRLIVAYGNGLIILWGLHETQVLAVRGGTEDQRLQLSNFSASLRGRAIAAPSKHEVTDEEEEVKEICCVCWACPLGSVLAVGYTDGEILFWSFPTIIKAKGQRETEFVEGPVYSGQPLQTVDLAPGKVKMPVVGLSWGASDRSSRGIGGRLYVFGGREIGQAEAIMILSLDSLNGKEIGAKLVQLELGLDGPFADMALLPAPGGTLTNPAAALALLMIPGLVYVFDELSIANYFAAVGEGMPPPPSPEPVPLQLPVTESRITCAKLVLVSNDEMAAKLLLQLPLPNSSLRPSTLPAGTKWPISGGALSPASSGQLGAENLYITGHENGHVNFWDASSQFYSLLCTVETASGASGKFAVTTFEFCPTSGLLAVGAGNGVVFVYNLSNEARPVNCSILEASCAKGESAKEQLIECEPGFGCIIIQNVHKAAISAISVASGPSLMAVADDSGMVSLIDLKSRTMNFYECCFPSDPHPILAVAFTTELSSEEGTPTSPRSPRSPRLLQSRSKNKSVPGTMGHTSVLYVVGKDATMVAIDGYTGAVFGSGGMQPKHPSTAVSLYLLDAGGAPVGLLDRQLDETFQSGGLGDPVDFVSTAASAIQDESMQRTSHEAQSSDACGTSSEALFLLLCCTDSLRLYSTHAVIQGQRTMLCKVKLDIECSWTSAFLNEGRKEPGLIVMSNAGDIEFRSLPDLGLLKQTSLSTVLGWKVEPTGNSLKTVACNVNGELVMADHDSELFHMYILERDSARDRAAPSRLYDKDLAKAADAAITYARTASRKKAQTPVQGMQGILGGVLKELKNVLEIEQQGVVHTASDLPKLFASSPFTIPPVEPKTPTYLDAPDSPVPLPSPGAPIEIDDIDVEYTEAESQQLQSQQQQQQQQQQHQHVSSPVEGSRGRKFTDRLSGAIKSLKGKERSEESNRMELFDGKDEPRPSKAKTVDDIRAKYGHPRKSQELSGALDQTRHKLAERGEKLQDISDKTAEMEDNAQNFASLAEELAKKMGRKKWWEL